MPELFGIGIDPLTFDEAVERITSWLTASGQPARYVVTPNVNHVVMYQSDEPFRSAYRGASLTLPDGRYVVLAARLLGKPLGGVVNGSDLVPAILSSMQDEQLSVFLLGAMPGVGEKAVREIGLRWPGIRVVGVYSPPLGFEASSGECEEMVRRVNSTAPDLLILGISPPKQEVWIAEHAAALKTKVAICAGATIDYLAGEKPRAPSWMQRAGLEWVYRVWSEPARLSGRYFADGIKFAGLLVRELLSGSRRLP